MASPANSKTADGLDKTTARVLEIIRPGKREHQTRMRRYDKAYDIWRATVPTPRGVEPWQSKLRIPFAKQVIDTAMYNIVSGEPRVKVTPRHPENELAAKAMQYILDYYIQEDHLVERQPVFALQALIYGVTCAKVHWLYKTGKAPKKVYRTNEFDPSISDMSVESKQVVLRDGPTFEPWDVYRTYWSPGARTADDAGYVVLQSYLDKDELRKLAVKPDGGGIFHNVDELIASGDGPQPQSTSQERVVRADRDRVQGKFLVEEIWTDDDLVVIGNGHTLLRAQANPYWHGKKPIVITSTSPDMFEMLGISETEIVDDLQQALWTVINRRMDNEHLTVMRGITYREGGVTNPDDLQMRPRFKWPVSDHDDIRPFEVAPLPPESFEEEKALQAMLQTISGINPYVSGSDLQSVDQNTATGVTALQDVASRNLRFKAGQLAHRGYQRVFEMWGDMTQQFLDRNIAVKIVGQGGDESWLDIGPQDVVGHHGYRLQGTEESLSRQQERGEAIALLNSFAPLAALNIVNFGPILERIADAYNFPNPESLIQAPPAPPPPAAPMGAAPGQPQQGGAPPDLQNVLGPRIGMVPQRNSYMQQGGIQMDPRLAAALGQMGQQIPK